MVTIQAGGFLALKETSCNLFLDKKEAYYL